MVLLPRFATNLSVRRFGEEASDGARVWKLYRDRANEQDHDKIDGWNKTLDILLIFVSGQRRYGYAHSSTHSLQAGLFSAVATAFLIES